MGIHSSPAITGWIIIMPYRLGIPYVSVPVVLVTAVMTRMAFMMVAMLGMHFFTLVIMLLCVCIGHS